MEKEHPTVFVDLDGTLTQTEMEILVFYFISNLSSRKLRYFKLAIFAPFLATIVGPAR
jgi:hypothetical protein